MSVELLDKSTLKLQRNLKNKNELNSQKNHIVQGEVDVQTTKPGLSESQIQQRRNASKSKLLKKRKDQWLKTVSALYDEDHYRMENYLHEILYPNPAANEFINETGKDEWLGITHQQLSREKTEQDHQLQNHFVPPSIHIDTVEDQTMQKSSNYFSTTETKSLLNNVVYPPDSNSFTLQTPRRGTYW